MTLEFINNTTILAVGIKNVVFDDKIMPWVSLNRHDEYRPRNVWIDSCFVLFASVCAVLFVSR